jgi:hypothetical protein
MSRLKAQLTQCFHQLLLSILQRFRQLAGIATARLGQVGPSAGTPAPPGPPPLRCGGCPPPPRSSERILNRPISAVLATWVPPQSSIDTPGTSTTRTVGPVLFAKHGHRPGGLGPLQLHLFHLQGVGLGDPAVDPLFDPLQFLGVRARGQWKSNRSLSKSTREPAWEIDGIHQLFQSRLQQMGGGVMGLGPRRQARPPGLSGCHPPSARPARSGRGGRSACAGG